MSDSAVVGTFLGRDITQGIGLLGQTVIVTVLVYVLYRLKCTLWGCSPLLLDVMCCNNLYAGVSANSQGTFPRAHRAQ